jgi:hypothetical protein
MPVKARRIRKSARGLVHSKTLSRLPSIISLPRGLGVRQSSGALLRATNAVSLRVHWWKSQALAKGDKNHDNQFYINGLLQFLA